MMSHARQAEGRQPHEEVRKFYAGHYSSNIMKGAVMGRHSLDELEAMVRAKFQGIGNADLRVPEFDGKFLPLILFDKGCCIAHPLFLSMLLCLIWALLEVCCNRKVRIQSPCRERWAHHLTSACNVVNLSAAEVVMARQAAEATSHLHDRHSLTSAKPSCRGRGAAWADGADHQDGA